MAYAFVDVLRANDPDSVETIAMYAHGEITENITYGLADTSCENVIGQTLCCYTAGVQQAFPTDDLLKELNAESYIGIPLWASDGTPIGLLAVMDVVAVTDPGLARSILQIVAVRAAAELENRANRQAIERFERAIDASDDGIAFVGHDYCYIDVSETFAKRYGKTKSDFIGQHVRIAIGEKRFETIYKERIDQCLAGHLNAQQLEYAQFIERSGQHLLSIINDILDMSKLDIGKITLRPEKTNIQDLINEAVTLVDPLAKQNNVALSIAHAPHMTRTVDPLRVRQCLFNLLSNAIKFAKDGTATISATHGVNEIRLSVADTGIGMSAAEIARCMEPFTQSDYNQHSRRFQGTGLGLALTQKLMELHQGSGFIDSKKGVGTTATLIFPHRNAALS